MKEEYPNSLNEYSAPLELPDSGNSDYSLIEPEPFLLEEFEPEPFVNKKDNCKDSKVLSILFTNTDSVTSRASSNIESRINTTLTELIELRIQTKPLPLALRKRLMYQRAISA